MAEKGTMIVIQDGEAHNVNTVTPTNDERVYAYEDSYNKYDHYRSLTDYRAIAIVNVEDGSAHLVRH